MKSIIEEASSVVKAIEKGWIQAGKPQEFSVKIFQEAEKNFLGMTTKSAKIAILYESAPTKSNDSLEKKNFKQKPAVAPRQQKPFEEKNITSQSLRPLPNVKEERERPVRKEMRPAVVEQELIGEEANEKRASKQNEPFWSDAMLAHTTEWLNNSLTFLNKANAPFTLEQKRYYLKINFEKPLFNDAEKEKMVFRSFSYLLMQVLRNKFKRNFRGFKLILTSPAS
jgi:predicted RNA-binding protein Jag